MTHTPHANPHYVDAFITMALPVARQVKTKWGVPIAVLIAQAAEESGWGRKVVNNAYFGIKGRTSDGGSVSFPTHEVVNGKSVGELGTFRAYKSFADAADDYGRFLSTNPRTRYAFTFKNDPVRFAQAIANAGYATNPNYGKDLIAIIHSHNLAQYDA